GDGDGDLHVVGIARQRRLLGQLAEHDDRVVPDGVAEIVLHLYGQLALDLEPGVAARGRDLALEIAAADAVLRCASDRVAEVAGGEGVQPGPLVVLVGLRRLHGIAATAGREAGEHERAADAAQACHGITIRWRSSPPGYQ